MGVLSFGAAVSAGWRSTASGPRVRVQAPPRVITIAQQRKLPTLYAQASALILGLLLLLLLALCCEIAVFSSIGTAVTTISRDYLQKNLSQHHTDGDGFRSSSEDEDALAPPSNSPKR